MVTLQSIQGFIADMDGVLWRGNTPLNGAAEFFQSLEHPYVFATNNSSRTIDYYMEKLNGFGIPAEPHQIITSAVATAAYLKANYADAKTAFVVGGEGLRVALQSEGFDVIDDGQPDLVVAGIDFDLTYDKLKHAVLSIRAGAAFIGSNADKTYPVPNGLAPGAGTVLAAIQTGTDIEPRIIGKPHPPMFEIALSRLKTPAESTVMIGDRFETDIWGAYELGIKTALMLTGVSQETDIINSEIKPDWVYPDMPALLADYKDART